MQKVFVAGYRGMVGGAIRRRLEARGDVKIITRTHAELDLTSQADVRDFMQAERPDVVVLAAARVGGIHANNTYPADFIYDNLMIECNVIHQAFAAGVQKLSAIGVVLHLSARRSTAHGRKRPADRDPGTNK